VVEAGLSGVRARRFVVPVFHRFSLLRSRHAAVILCALAMLLGVRFGDDAAEGRNEVSVPSVAASVADPTLDPRIVAMELRGTDWNARLADLEAVLFARRDAERRVVTTTAALQSARLELRLVQDELGTVRVEAADIDERRDRHRSALQARALELFVGFGEEARLDELDSIEEATAGARHRQLAAEVDEHQLGLLRVLEDERAGLGTAIADLEGRFLALRTNVAALREALAAARDDRTRAVEALPAAEDAVRRARRTAVVPGLDIPVVALDAYLRAEVTLAESDPTCGLAWWMIAGVGRVESRHGTLGGRSLHADGRPNRPIIGIALDGGPGIRAIADTDSGALDGDVEWDRAVGPMQFIPETWSIRGRDGNDDGVRDPHNLYDAALAAGRYLCGLGGDLSKNNQLEEAYFGYNTSSDYVSLVTGHARHYAAAEIPSRPLENGQSVDETGDN